MTARGYAALLGAFLITGGVQLGAQDAASPAATQPGKATIIERVLVRVNGEILTQTELTREQAAVARDEQFAALSPEEQQAKLTEITPPILGELVNQLLLVQRAREMGATFSDKQFTDAMENLKKENNLTDEQLDVEIIRAGLTREQLRQQFERMFLIQTVQAREIGPSMTITQPEQRQYYEAHPEEFMTDETVTLRQLLIPVLGEAGQPPNPVADSTARNRLESLRAQALAGADFAQLVRDNASTDAARSNGGLIGPVRVEDLNPALADTILKLAPGEISPIVRTSGGYQMLKLEERITPELRPFESVRGEIEGAIRNERLGPETEKMIRRLRENAVIEWKDDTYKQMYEKWVTDQQQASAASGADAAQ